MVSGPGLRDLAAVVECQLAVHEWCVMHLLRAALVPPPCLLLHHVTSALSAAWPCVVIVSSSFTRPSIAARGASELHPVRECRR
jgi:hypothetical protein